jgi:hypothetical protein
MAEPKSTDCLQNLDHERNFLISLKAEDLQDEINCMLDNLIKKQELTCIYVSLNKPYQILKKNLENQKYNLKKFFFVDAVGKNGEKIENVMYVPDSRALTQIDMAVTQIAQIVQDNGFVLIDSLEGLNIGNSPTTLAGFIRTMISKLAKYNSKLILLTCGGVEDKFINQISPFFDKVIKRD